MKLRDYQARWAELEASDNPCATVVMAHLQTRVTQRDPAGRLQEKLRLMCRLYVRGYTRQDILELFRFIDWVMILPEELEVHFQMELARLEEETQMPYITSIERMGIERGLQQGRQEGLQQGEVTVLRRLLSRRFGPLPAWAEERLAQASLQELEQWTDRVLEAPQLDAVFAAG